MDVIPYLDESEFVKVSCVDSFIVVGRYWRKEMVRKMTEEADKENDVHQKNFKRKTLLLPSLTEHDNLEHVWYNGKQNEVRCRATKFPARVVIITIDGSAGSLLHFDFCVIFLLIPPLLLAIDGDGGAFAFVIIIFRINVHSNQHILPRLLAHQEGNTNVSQSHLYMKCHE